MPVTPPSWSLDSYFATPEAFQEFHRLLRTELQEALDSPPTDWVRRILAIENFSLRLGHLESYLGCRTAAATHDVEARTARAALSETASLLVRLQAALRGWLAGLDDRGFAALVSDPQLKTAAASLADQRHRGLSSMPAPLEDLAASLAVDGIHAWSRLYDTLSGSMQFDFVSEEGIPQRLPMSRRRSLMADPDRSVRQAAFVEGQKPWVAQADTLAAAINGLAGTRLKLNLRRGGRHFLEGALDDARLSRGSLEALRSALMTEAPRLRACLRAAAKRQGTSALSFYDLEAPQVAPPQGVSWNWAGAVNCVQTSFDKAYPGLGSYFREMLARRWIDAEPRAGKLPGAFCTDSGWIREERVFLSHHDTFADTLTLAHEVGHAWHSSRLRGERALCSAYPMTLAETASNFAEMLVLKNLLQDSSPSLREFLLDQSVLRVSTYLLNIPMRFEFECRMHEERADGELTADRLCDLMVQAQRSVYGDALSLGEEDPWFWASKMHFFLSDVSFYNFPYAFGHLLAQAISTELEAKGPDYLNAYEAFLRLSGSDRCENVVQATLGFDLSDADFWREAVRSAVDPLQPYLA